MKLILLYNEYALTKMKPCYSKGKKFIPRERIFSTVSKDQRC